MERHCAFCGIPAELAVAMSDEVDEVGDGDFNVNRAQATKQELGPPKERFEEKLFIKKESDKKQYRTCYIAMPDWVIGARRREAGVSKETEKWKAEPGEELRLPELPAEAVRKER